MGISPEKAVAKYASRGVLIDSNIVLLYVVGGTDPQMIAQHKRTQSFRIDDFHLLDEFLARFHRKVTTPSILTEVSNLAGQIGEPLRSRCLQRLRQEIEELHEHFDPSVSIAADELFPAIGLTDCAIKWAAQTGYLVLTDDFRLTNRLTSLKIDAINFNHLRATGFERA